MEQKDKDLEMAKTIMKELDNEPQVNKFNAILYMKIIQTFVNYGIYYENNNIVYNLIKNIEYSINSNATDYYFDEDVFINNVCSLIYEFSALEDDEREETFIKLSLMEYLGNLPEDMLMITFYDSKSAFTVPENIEELSNLLIKAKKEYVANFGLQNSENIEIYDVKYLKQLKFSILNEFNYSIGKEVEYNINEQQDTLYNNYKIAEAIDNIKVNDDESIYTQYHCNLLESTFDNINEIVCSVENYCFDQGFKDLINDVQRHLYLKELGDYTKFLKLIDLDYLNQKDIYCLEYNDYIENTKDYNLKVNLFLVTDEEFNQDLSSIKQYYKNNDANKKYSNNGLSYLIIQQGYKPEDILISNKHSVFLDSVKEALDEFGLETTSVFASVKLSVDDLLNIKYNPDYHSIILNKDTSIGLIEGGISIQLEKDLEIPISMVRNNLIEIENTNGYYYPTINDIYGLVDNFWGKTFVKSSNKKINIDEMFVEDKINKRNISLEK